MHHCHHTHPLVRAHHFHRPACACVCVCVCVCACVSERSDCVGVSARMCGFIMERLRQDAPTSILPLVCVCMCVCVHVCVCACEHVCKERGVNVFVSIRICWSVYERVLSTSTICAITFIQPLVRVCVCVCVHACVRARGLDVCVNTYMCAWVGAW